MPSFTAHRLRFVAEVTGGLPHRLHEPGLGDRLVTGDETGAVVQGCADEDAVVDIGDGWGVRHCQNNVERQRFNDKPWSRLHAGHNLGHIKGQAPALGEENDLGKDDDRYDDLALARSGAIKCLTRQSTETRRALQIPNQRMGIGDIERWHGLLQVIEQAGLLLDAMLPQPLGPGHVAVAEGGQLRERAKERTGGPPFGCRRVGQNEQLYLGLVCQVQRFARLDNTILIHSMHEDRFHTLHGNRLLQVL